jgi:hypothetical protein
MYRKVGTRYFSHRSDGSIFINRYCPEFPSVVVLCIKKQYRAVVRYFAKSILRDVSAIKYVVFRCSCRVSPGHCPPGCCSCDCCSLSCCSVAVAPMAASLPAAAPVAASLPDSVPWLLLPWLLLP